MLRSYYLSAGYGQNHRVALIMQNRADFLLHWLALNALGCSVVPINDEMVTQEQAYIINHSDACLLVYLPDLAGTLEQLQPLLENKPHCIASNELPLLAAPAEAAQTSAADRDTECALLYTSGSTGQPKGCILSNDYFLLSGQRYLDLGGLCRINNGQDRLITPLPLVHMNAMACSTLAMVLSGGCLVQLDRFHPRTWWQTVRESRATIVHYLGVMPAMLLGMEADEDDFSKQVRFAFGAGVNTKHHQAFEQRFGFPLIEAWAMTETGNNGCIIANQEPRHVGSSCFGKPPPHLEIKLVDEQGDTVATGDPGELLLRHRGGNPHKGFFTGYLKNPKATTEAWTDGWFHTGDVVRQDQTGSMYFVDRRKNVIRRSGENISALEVESALSDDVQIKLVVVCPVPDDIRGDEVMACVIPAADVKECQNTAEQIAKRALNTLVYYKVPGYIGFYDSLPLTPSEKPKRAEIKALAINSLENNRCFDVRHLKKRSGTGS